MQFAPIDLQTWPCAQMFRYFAKIAPTGYSLTAKLDIAARRQALQRAGLKSFPAYLWLITQTLNQQPEFKLAERKGQLGYYDTLTPLYAAFHEEDHTFSCCGRSLRKTLPCIISAICKTANNTGALTAC